MSKKKKARKGSSLKRFLLISTLWLFIILIVTGRFWGIWGTVGKVQSSIILHSLLPYQKKELADALNFHYKNTTLRRCTKGLILSCKPNVESILQQFNWFYRNTISSSINSFPGYHTIIKDTIHELNGGAVIPIKKPSTFELESIIIEYEKKYGDTNYTEKDKNSDHLTQLCLLLKYGFIIVVPEISLTVSVIGLAHDMDADMEKLVPAIECFQHIRILNWLFSSALLWLFILLINIKITFLTKKTK